MRLFGELTKIEDQPDGTLKVYGVASTGARDDAGEIVRPEAMQAALPDYARYPALREMHQPTAAGRTLEAQVDDDGVTRIVAHVVDPVAIAKVRSRTYAGFSIGGKVLARDAKDPTVITKIKLSEISLVDRPANPEAVIDLWKAERDPPPLDNTAVKARAAELAKRAGRPGAWKDYVARARAGMLAEADGPSGDGAWSDGGADESPPPDDCDAPEAESAAEGAGDSDADVGDGDEAEAAEDGDDSHDDEGIDGGGADDPAAIAARLAALFGSDPPALQAIHDALAALGAACDPDNCPDTEKSSVVDDFAKRAPAVAAMLAKAATRLDSLETRLAEQDAVIQRLAATPTPPKAAAGPHARAIGKADDADPAAEPDIPAAEAQKAFAALTADERAFLLMKASLRRPIPLR